MTKAKLKRLENYIKSKNKNSSDLYQYKIYGNIVRIYKNGTPQDFIFTESL